MFERHIKENTADVPKQSGVKPFAQQIADNPDVIDVKYGRDAMMMAGAQSEFIAANLLQAQALKCVVILRASEPPQYNKLRGSKSSINLTKTSKQGFFKGALSSEQRFSRLDQHREPLSLHEKDLINLALAPTNSEYQHTLQLDINMRDILREVSPEGDLQILGFDEESGLLRLEYKEAHGPKKERFNGQLVIYLNDDTALPLPQFYSRDWDQPEHDPKWDIKKEIIKKPAELNAIPDPIYERFFNHTFKVAYTEEKLAKPDANLIKKAEVFANRPRNAREFKKAMGGNHPQFELIRHCTTLGQILDTIKTAFPQAEAEQIIRSIYDKSGLIVAGDWDGMALGHPPGLDPLFSEVIDTYKPGIEGPNNQAELLKRADLYLAQIQLSALEKTKNGEAISAFENKALSISSIAAIVSDFSLTRAGCVTVHEFVFQQILNDAYRDNLDVHYGEKYDVHAVQVAMDKLLPFKGEIPDAEFKILTANVLKAELKIARSMSNLMLSRLKKYLLKHLAQASKDADTPYILPHIQHDVNVNDLYQHGFDMRNPNSCNLTGAWLLISEDGCVLYGSTEEQLIEVLLTGDLLKNNHIAINQGANMSLWHKVINRQLELGQVLPGKTMDRYQEYLNTQLKLAVPVIEKQLKLKNVLRELRELRQPHPVTSMSLS